MTSPLLQRITPLVRQILQAPNIVPSQVSAKTVRKSLVEEHKVDKEQLAAEKEEVKELILSIFQELYPDEGAGAAPEEPAAPTEDSTIYEAVATPMKKKHPQITASQASASASAVPSSPAVPLVDDANKKKRKRDTDNDEDLAKRLHQSLNEERSTRGSSSSATMRKRIPPAGGSKGKKSRVKSKAIVDDDEEEESASEDGKGKKKKKAKSADGTGAAKGGFSKPMILSSELADVLATDTLSRPQVVKQIWDYIKNHELQNPANKRVILCDEKLQRVFKVPEIDMFQMNKVLSSHLRTAEE